MNILKDIRNALIKHKFNLFTIMFFNKRYESYSKKIVKINKDYLRECYFNNDVLIYDNRKLISLYSMFETNNLMIFYSTLSSIGGNSLYYIFFKEFNEYIEQDLFKIFKIYKNNWVEFNKALVNIFDLKGYPEYFI